MLYLDYIFRMSIDIIKKMVSHLKKARSRRYPAETMTDTVYADDLALLENILA